MSFDWIVKLEDLLNIVRTSGMRSLNEILEEKKVLVGSSVNAKDLKEFSGFFESEADLSFPKLVFYESTVDVSGFLGHICQYTSFSEIIIDNMHLDFIDCGELSHTLSRNRCPLKVSFRNLSFSETDLQSLAWHDIGNEVVDLEIECCTFDIESLFRFLIIFPNIVSLDIRKCIRISDHYISQVTSLFARNKKLVFFLYSRTLDSAKTKSYVEWITGNRHCFIDRTIETIEKNDLFGFKSYITRRKIPILCLKRHDGTDGGILFELAKYGDERIEFLKIVLENSGRKNVFFALEHQVKRSRPMYFAPNNNNNKFLKLLHGRSDDSMESEEVLKLKELEEEEEEQQQQIWLEEETGNPLNEKEREKTYQNVKDLFLKVENHVRKKRRKKFRKRKAFVCKRKYIDGKFAGRFSKRIYSPKTYEKLKKDSEYELVGCYFYEKKNFRGSLVKEKKTPWFVPAELRFDQEVENQFPYINKNYYYMRVIPWYKGIAFMELLLENGKKNDFIVTAADIEKTMKMESGAEIIQIGTEVPEEFGFDRKEKKRHQIGVVLLQCPDLEKLDQMSFSKRKLARKFGYVLYQFFCYGKRIFIFADGRNDVWDIFQLCQKLCPENESMKTDEMLRRMRDVSIHYNLCRKIRISPDSDGLECLISIRHLIKLARVRIKKKPTIMDTKWNVRHLSTKQQRYGAEDVVGLILYLKFLRSNRKEEYKKMLSLDLRGLICIGSSV